jgi:hypothetical protein
MACCMVDLLTLGTLHALLPTLWGKVPNCAVRIVAPLSIVYKPRDVVPVWPMPLTFVIVHPLWENGSNKCPTCSMEAVDVAFRVGFRFLRREVKAIGAWGIELCQPGILFIRR